MVKYGEHPMRLRGVTLSAQNTEYTPKDHRFWSPSTTLNSDWWTSKWVLYSTIGSKVVAADLYMIEMIAL
jgi:hypothetical protein